MLLLNKKTSSAQNILFRFIGLVGWAIFCSTLVFIYAMTPHALSLLKKFRFIIRRNSTITTFTFETFSSELR